MEKKVLFVDDEPSIVMMLAQLFRDFGYTPHYATTGEEALKLMKEHSIRFVMTDLRMPEMDGMEVCRRVKEIDPTAHVYALSAYVTAFTPEQFKEAGFNGFFPKPFKLDELIKICTEAFEQMDNWGDATPGSK